MFGRIRAREAYVNAISHKVDEIVYYQTRFPYHIEIFGYWF